MEDYMATFIISMSWTDQAIRAIEKPQERAQFGRQLAKKFGVEYKELYLTTGDSDLMVIVQAPSMEHVAKFALSLSSRGNVRTRTCQAWPEAEYMQLVSELR
jgi:uncharacterized protein with GYD domain